ncbi:adhesion G-protein coupled receptor G6 isoform X2 [Xenopus tropicalis]|uniref:Adhesion G-protein coupled receptor G6 isoform X2 n=1 Tax=Xenopus tropicalis TaxID=8364 RepID=A0A8J1JJ21_XENTR|nr:adhesion G-protein coupled receptor G6 isoform X2 [Xenopus tropicalis]
MIFQISGLWCSHWKWKMQYILLFFVVYVAFVQHSVLSCAVCRLTLTAPTGNVTSPCYPQLYPNNQDCKWIIQAPKGFIIQLTFVDFDVEEAQNCVYDYVSISNGETTTKYCGVTARGLTYNSTGNMMNISFVSDFSIQRKGFTATYKNVPVTLRNLKVTIPQNQSLGIVSVVSTVIVPTLNQFTVCFEAARFISSPAEWKAFTYWNSLTESLSFGKSPSGHFVYISGIQCHLNLTLTSLTVTGEFFTETLQEMCITWDSRSQIVGVKTGNNFQTSTCLESKDLHIPGNGSLILGCYDNKTSSLQGDIYNFRLWDTAFESVALSNLSCDQKGNIVNWENDFWSIPSWARKAGTDLSCGTSLSSTPSTATTTCKNLGGVCQAIAAQSATKQKQSTTATTATALSSTVPFTVSSTVPSNVSSTVASSVTSTISSTIVSTISSIASSTKTSTMSSSVPITVSSSIASSLLSTISSTILSTSSSTITSSKSSGAQSTVSSNVVSNESGTKSPTAPSSIASPPLSTVSSTILSASSSTKISSKSSSAQSTISSNIASNESGTKSPTAPSSIASPLLSNVSSTILSASSSTKISSKSSSAQSTVSSNLASNESRTNSPTAASSIASPLLSTVSSTILSASSSNKISSKSINVQSTISSNLASNESGTKSPTAPFSIASPLLSNVSSTILSASSSTKISSKSSSAQSTVSSNLASNESRIESTTAPSPIASPLLSTVLSTIFLTSSSTITSSKSSSAQSTVSSNFASNESATKSPTEPSSLVSPPLSTVSSTILSASSSTKISSKSSSAQSTIASNLASNESRTKSPTAPSSIASPLLSTVSSTILSTSSSTKTSSKSSSAQSTVFSNLASNESSTKSPSAPSSIASPLLSTVSSTILSSSSSTKTSSKSSSAQSTVLSNLASNESSIKSPSHESSTKSSNVSSTVSSTVLSTEPSPLKPTVPSILSSTVPSSSTLSESTEKSNVSSSIRSTVLSTLSTKSSTTTSTVPSVLLYTVPLIVSPVVPFTISPSMSSTVPSSETSSVSSTVTSSISSSVRSTEPSTLSSTVPSTIPSAVPIIVPSVMSSTVPSTMSSTVHSSETSTMPSTLLRAESSIISAVSSSLSSTIPYTTVTSTVSTLSFTDTTTSTTVTTNSASLATISTALPSPLNSITAPASSVTNATLSTASPSTLSTTNSFGTTTNYSSNSATLSTVTSSSLRTSQLTTTYSPSSATQTTVSTTSFTTSNLNDTTYSSSSATVTSDFSSTLNNMINTTTSNATSSPSTMITINMNDTNNINNSQPDLQERNISATFLIRMKRNPVTSSWTHLQLQDSKIKGLRGIGIISTPIVWPVKQRPAATEKGSALKEAPDNINAADFFFIPTQSTLSLSTTFRTTEISKNITIDDKLTQNISTHRNITLFLKNTSQLFDQESSKEDGSVQQDTEGSGIGNVVSSRKVSNISLDHMQISNASGRWHLHLDSIWHNSENIIVGLNDKHMAGSSDGLYQTFLNVISHPSHSTAHVSHLLSDNSLNIDKISRSCVPHNKHTSAIMPTTVYSDCISLENADKAFAVESSGLLSKFLTIPVHGTYVLQNIKETKTPFDANANLQVELNPSEHSILSSNLASLMLRNKYIHSVTTHNKDSTSSNSPSSYDLSSCNTVKTEFVSDNLNPDIPVPLPGSLPAQRANMQLLSNYYMGKFLSPSRTMIGHTHLTTNYVSESQEGLSVEVLGPLDASLNQQLMDISDSLTPSYDLLHSQLRDSRDILYNSFSPSYNVHFNQWQYTTLPYELVTSNMKASTEDPYQQQTAQLPSVEDLQANIEERLEEYDYGSTPFSGDKDFLEEEKLYLVSRNSIIRSSKSKEVVLLNSLITSSNQIEFIGNEFQVKKSYLSGHENDNYSPLETENLDSKKKTVHASQTSLSHEEKVQIQGLPIYPVYITKTLYLPCTLEKMINSGMDNAAKQNMITNTRFIQPLSKATYLDMNDLKNNKGLFAENIMSNYALEYNIFSSNSDDIDFGLSGASETPPLVHTLNGPQTPITQTLEHFPSNGDILSHPDIKIQASISNGRTAVFQGQPESIKGLYAQYFEDPNILFGVSFKSSISLLTTEWSHWSVEPSLKPPTGHVKNTDGVSTMEMSVLHTASQLLSSAFERVGISTFSTEKTATKAIIDPFLGQSSGYLYSSKEEGNYFSGTGPLFSSYGFYNQISAEGPHCSCNIFTDSACLCGLEVNGSM